jgi:acyl-CoA hydrolase
VIYVGRTSMVVRVRIYAENPLVGDRRVCTTGYFSMVAVSQDGRPVVPVPTLLLPDAEARSEYEQGAEIHATIVARRTA